MVDDALRVRALINGLHSRYHRAVVEQAAIAGALNAESVNDLGQRQRRWPTTSPGGSNVIAEDTERGWQGRTVTVQ